MTVVGNICNEVMFPTKSMVLFCGDEMKCEVDSGFDICCLCMICDAGFSGQEKFGCGRQPIRGQLGSCTYISCPSCLTFSLLESGFSWAHKYLHGLLCLN